MELTPKGQAAIVRARSRRGAEPPASLAFEDRCSERLESAWGGRAPLSLVEGLFRFRSGMDAERQRRLYCDLPLVDEEMVERGRKMVENDRRTHRTTRAIKELRAEIAREMREWRLTEKAKKVAAAAVCVLVLLSSCSSPSYGKGPSNRSHAPSTAANPPSLGAGSPTAPSPATTGATATRDGSPRGGTSGASANPGAPIYERIEVYSNVDLSFSWGRLDGMCEVFGKSIVIRISRNIDDDPARCRAVCAHELGHALGLDHTDVALTWMHPQGTNAPPVTWPTDAEIEAARRCVGTRTFFVRLVDVSYGAALSVRWAVATWNAVLGRNALVIE